MIYELKSGRGTLHGYFSSSLKPVLEIQSGDIVKFQTLEADWRVRDTEVRKTEDGDFFPYRRAEDIGHALCGPVFVKGAKAGMSLAVTVHSIHCGSWGWSRVGGGDEDHLQRIGYKGSEYFLHWKIDHEKEICTSHLGHKVMLKPFMGVFAVAPCDPGCVPTHQPDRFGGNLDCKELGEGATVYLPVFTEGALFSTGDGHAAQGDGELGGTAIEVPIDVAEMEFHLKEIALERPVCRTEKGWLTFGFDRNLTTATYTALKDMISLMERLYRMEYKEAVALASLVVDIKITQIVNGVRGVHAFLPHGAVNGTCFPLL